MKKKYSLVIIIGSIFLLISLVGANDEIGVSKFYSDFTYNSDMTLLADNDVTVSDDSDFEDDLLEKFEENSIKINVADPIYYFNYAMYTFNDVLYFVVLKPLATGYKHIAPTVVRKGIKNFFHNLMFPVRFVNNLLQGKGKEAVEEIQIFVINTTMGGLGFGQVAQNHYELYTSNEDLGQTLGSYEIGHGFYIVLPVFGPSTLRDTVGRVGDYFITPMTYVEPSDLKYGLTGLNTINSTSFRLGDYETLKKNAIDPYEAFKNAYIQLREVKVKE